MRTWFRRACATLAIVLAVAAAVGATSEQVQYDDGVMRLSIWTAPTEQWPKGYPTNGSGVVIAPRVIVTAAHVAVLSIHGHPDDPTVVPIRVGSLSVPTIQGRVLWLNADLDLAVVVTDVDLPKLRALRCEDPTPGEPVTIVGYPNIHGFSPRGATITRGIVSTIVQYNSRTREEFYIVDSAVMGGNSGGPVFDRNGRVVGIAVAHYGTWFKLPPEDAKQDKAKPKQMFIPSTYTVVVPSSTLCRVLGRT